MEMSDSSTSRSSVRAFRDDLLELAMSSLTSYNPWQPKHCSLQIHLYKVQYKDLVIFISFPLNTFIHSYLVKIKSIHGYQGVGIELHIWAFRLDNTEAIGMEEQGESLR